MRDIRVQVLLSPEEYLALEHLADEEGDSHSGMLRRLFLRHARQRAQRTVDSSMDGSASSETAEPAHIVRT